MGVRERTALALIPLILAAVVFLPPWVYLTAIWIITMASGWELLALLRQGGYSVPLAPAMVALGAGLPILWVSGLEAAVPVLGVIILGLPLTYLVGSRPLQGATAGFSATTWAVLYFTATGVAMGMLRLAFPDQVGIKLVILHCLTIWGGDSGAYYFGSRFGRRRMAPRISPKKSWEGLAAGVATTFFGVWVCRTVFFGELPLGLAVTLAGVLAVAAPLGDLLESLMKRDVGVKDSSGLIPGHGGFLDRTDSVFFAAPLVVATTLLWGNPW